MRAFALLFPLMVVACVEVAPPPGQDPVLPFPIADACRASELQFLVGQPETVLRTMKFANTVRIIHPDTAVTMDYRADRLNIEINKKSRIKRVNCG